jgi:hypothetical protein
MYWKLVLATVLLAAWSTAAVFLLRQAGIWDETLVKDTLLWFAFAAVPLAFNALGHASEEHFFRDAIAQQLRLQVIIQWLINAYTFSLVTELLVLPLLASIAAMSAIAEGNEQHRMVHSFLTGLMGIYVLVLIGFSLFQAASSFTSATAAEAFTQIVSPVLLTAALLPVAAIFGLFGQFEQLAIQVGRGRPQMQWRIGAIRVIWFWRFRTSAIAQFRSRYSLELLRVRSDADLRQVLAMAASGQPGERELLEAELGTS